MLPREKVALLSNIVRILAELLPYGAGERHVVFRPSSRDRIVLLLLQSLHLRQRRTHRRMLHIAQDVAKYLLGDAAVQRLSKSLKGLDVRQSQESVIIQHLLKVRYQPLPVGGIPVKTIADVTNIPPLYIHVRVVSIMAQFLSRVFFLPH